MGGAPRSAKQANLSSATSSAYGRLPGATLTAAACSRGERLHPSAYVVRQIFAGGVSRYVLNDERGTNPVGAPGNDSARRGHGVDSAHAIRAGRIRGPDQMIDQWVEQELRRGRSSVRAGLAMLVCLAVVAVPLVLWF